MNEERIRAIMSIVETVSTSLDTTPEKWPEHVDTVRFTISQIDLLDTTPDEGRKRWQISLISTFQRLASMDADNGSLQDVANWCLRQELALLQVYSEDIELLCLIGRNWLIRAQKSLAKIHLAEGDSPSSRASSGFSQHHPFSRADDSAPTMREAVEVEERLHQADYVEARGILLPATEYLKRAVHTAQAQGKLNGSLLTNAAEAFMSLGNVSPARINEKHYHEALEYLRAATSIPNYDLPSHLQHYLNEYGPLDRIT